MNKHLSIVIASRFPIDSAMLVYELVTRILHINVRLFAFSVKTDVNSNTQGGKKVRQTMISEIAKFTKKYVVRVFEWFMKML
jgi:hypothetical protein